MRSRSRWRIFSRSSATAFIRLSSESPASSGIASVKTVAIAAIAAKHHRQEARVVHLVDDQIEHGQKSKLIIFFMRHDSHDIQKAEPASIMRPSGAVHSSAM